MAKRIESMIHALVTACLMTSVGSPAFSQEQSGSSVDRAYAAPVAAEPALPALPPTPILSQKGYPDCREDFQKIAAPFDKAKETNRCTVLLDRYYSEVLTPFRQKMIDHQNQLSAVYTRQVAGQMKYSAKSRDDFYAVVKQEHAASDPDGAHLADYRMLESRYQQDRSYLQDRFCFNTGCGGYQVPEYVSKDDEAKKDKTDKKDGAVKSAKKSSGSQKCKKAKRRGGVLGGILGGVAGNAAGLGTIGTLISSGVGAVLVGEIACQLTQEEQIEAAEATVAVTEKEEVGATATWKSPTRAGVSGSSTVTAMNTQPNGRKCLNITDVAIIDGKETRVSKQMCRGQDDEGYTILA
ncbi:MAG: hypothetical protein V7676_08415 [Parasphingorhabdus sp.]|uniref:hypothetical protein n=1 Tax=Parasphingorhabdus sp. TaxID=2709688 RepID=UPI0030023144